MGGGGRMSAVVGTNFMETVRVSMGDDGGCGGGGDGGGGADDFGVVSRRTDGTSFCDPDCSLVAFSCFLVGAAGFSLVDLF